MNELLLRVPDMSCDHCVLAITAEMAEVAGVESADVRPATKTVRAVRSACETPVRAADAGYEAA